MTIHQPQAASHARASEHFKFGGYLEQQLTFRRRGRRAFACASAASLAVLVAVSCLVAGVSSPAFAQQAIERHAPPERPRLGDNLVIFDPNYGSSDTSPLGVDLVGIRLIGPGEKAGAAAAGISIGTVANAPDAALRAVLQPYLSKPLSHALIAQIQSAIARAWREAGYPFISVTVPPQEITAGILNLRVVEARFGSVMTEGNRLSDAERLAQAVRTERGGRIDAAGLEEDIRWMNRRGIRRVEGIFAPGQKPGESDLVLRVDSEKRWTAFGGWSNTGSRATGIDRYFLGGAVWLPELNDLTASYQLTGSGGFWSDPGRIALRTGDYPSYLGHAARIALPTSARQAIEFAPSFVATRETPDALVAFETDTVELPLSYRLAVSDIVPGFHFGDVAFGAEYTRMRRSSFFGGAAVVRGEAELFQLTAAWSHIFSDRHGRTAVDLGLTANPGGVVSGNTAARWGAFSGGRVDDVTYTYASLDVLRQTLLPGNFMLSHHLGGQISGNSLPDTERLQLGGQHAVRGYGIEDGTGDSGFVLRNELRLPPVSLVCV